MRIAFGGLSVTLVDEWPLVGAAGKGPGIWQGLNKYSLSKCARLCEEYKINVLCTQKPPDNLNLGDKITSRFSFSFPVLSSSSIHLLLSLPPHSLHLFSPYFFVTSGCFFAVNICFAVSIDYFYN